MAGILNHPNAKTKVNQFLQMHCKRPIAKDDIVYDTVAVSEGFQTTVTISALGGDQFVGEPCADQKSAEKLAAEQILEHYAETIATLQPSKKGKKNPAAGAPAAVMQPPAKKQKTQESDIQAAATAALAAAVAPAAISEANSNKVALNTACMKILRRALTKGEIKYETQKVATGFQCTCSIPSLPGEYETTGFTGEVSDKSKDAEQSAAGYALQALMEDPEMAPLLAAPKSQNNQGGGFKGGGKGKAKGFSGGWVCTCGFKNKDTNQVCGGPGPLGCNSPRPDGMGIGKGKNKGGAMGGMDSQLAMMQQQMQAMMANMMGM